MKFWRAHLTWCCMTPSILTVTAFTVPKVPIVPRIATSTTTARKLEAQRHAFKQRGAKLRMIDPWRDLERNRIPIVIAEPLEDSATTVVAPTNGDYYYSSESLVEQQQQQQQDQERNSISTAGASLGEEAMFGTSVPLPSRRTSSNQPVSTQVAVVAADEVATEDEDLSSRRRRNVVAAGLSVALVILNYLWQLLHPITPLSVLVQLQQTSAPYTVIGANAKPTVVDFWAPWCENCKIMAPTLAALEAEYKDSVNFVIIDGNEMSALPLVEAFNVDAIPHLALVDADGTVETALIGIIPKHVLAADLDVLIQNAKMEQACLASKKAATVKASEQQQQCTAAERQELPYQMLDALAGRSSRKFQLDIF